MFQSKSIIYTSLLLPRTIAFHIKLIFVKSFDWLARLAVGLRHGVPPRGPMTQTPLRQADTVTVQVLRERPPQSSRLTRGVAGRRPLQGRRARRRRECRHPRQRRELQPEPVTRPPRPLFRPLAS